MKKLLGIVVLGLLFLNSCSTPYQKSGFSGGYKEYFINENTFKIVAKGNAFTSQEKVQLIVLVRASEICKNKGKDIVEVLTANSRMKTSLYSTPSQGITTYTPGQQSSTVYSGGSVGSVSKPIAEITVRIYKYAELNSSKEKIQKDNAYGVKYFIAEDIIKYIKPTLN